MTGSRTCGIKIVLDNVVGSLNLQIKNREALFKEKRSYLLLFFLERGEKR